MDQNFHYHVTYTAALAADYAATGKYMNLGKPSEVQYAALVEFAADSITIVCYLVGLVMKALPFDRHKFIPIACGTAGGILGIAALLCGLPDFPANDLITAAAVGVISGVARQVSTKFTDR